MKTLKEKIAVMQAALDGKEIELKGESETEWRYVKNAGDVLFSWGSFDFRVKPEPLEFNVHIYKVGERNAYYLTDDRNAPVLGCVKTIKVREVLE